jgi:hypothetical protein
MRPRITAAGAALAVLALAGCGGSAVSSGPATPASSATASHRVIKSPAPSSAAVAAKANERLLVNGLASNSYSGLGKTVAGPVMHSYLRQEAHAVEADAAAGSPDPTGTVSTIPGGYQDCSTNSNGDTTCNGFTGFRTDAAGRITDATVDGQLISARLAVGTSTTSSRLVISDVGSYVPTAASKVVVSFKVRNVSSHAITGSPPFLALFDPAGGGQFSEDDNYSVLPGAGLQPGESALAYAVFDTREFTGQFSLRTNDQLMTVLASAQLRRP